MLYCALILLAHIAERAKSFGLDRNIKLLRLKWSKMAAGMAMCTFLHILKNKIEEMEAPLSYWQCIYDMST